MSISRALMLLLSGMLFIVLAGTFRTEIGSSRRFLEAQLATHAQDTATFLGLALSSTASPDERTAAESMIDAIFDRGYYRQIRMVDMQGKILVQRSLKLSIKDVPAWFVEALTLDPPAGDALVMSGWRQAGKVEVQCHPGFAYAQLWENFKGVLLWMGAAYVIGTMALALLLRFLLNQLLALEKMAVGIERREFPVLEPLPKSRELRQVAAAMNRMSRTLKTSFEEQTRFIETLRDSAYRDPVTRLANRTAFESRLRHLLRTPDAFPKGALYLIHVENFQAFNHKHGHMAGDQTLRRMASLIETQCQRYGQEYALARLTGAQFGILSNLWDKESQEALADRILAEMAGLYEKIGHDEPFVVRCGIGVYTGKESRAQLLALADHAQRSASRGGAVAWKRMTSIHGARSKEHGADALRGMLRRRLEKGDIEVEWSPVLATSDLAVLHREALVRIVDDTGNRLPAGQFLSLAEEMGVVPAIDRLVVERVMAQMTKPAAGSVAVNLSTTSLTDPDFMEWLCRILKERPDAMGELFFECREFDFINNLPDLEEPIKQLWAAGGCFGLDHFGLGPRSFGYLVHHRLAYLKMDGSYLVNVADNPENRFFIRSTANIAHELGIRLIATCVEDADTRELLNLLGFDGVQGDGFRASALKPVV
ncbi:EAL domain-containing protein [uncultured Desulfosarcina sp.]|uniref:EAL domain-containing protein n=1 Tax=uncultured Desulfosarcina sp. TaxID=218289 RepID=UPI0029C74E5B|nr:EAL domain-containing protein [uncultured Desulfosarcina sp.]